MTSDLGLWRCGEDYVLRVHGSEHLLTPSELATLLGFATDVASGALEALSPRYMEIARVAEARKANASLSLQALGLPALAALGLRPSNRTFRRPRSPANVPPNQG